MCGRASKCPHMCRVPLQVMHDLFTVPFLALPEFVAFMSELGGEGRDDDDAI